MLRRVLNVGGNNKSIALPPQYAGWQHDLLDIDPRKNPDVLCDARELNKLPAAGYDSIYCAHSLEHYYRRRDPRRPGWSAGRPRRLARRASAFGWLAGAAR
jgi:NADH:ubiquinone oxidoreductase subunit